MDSNKLFKAFAVFAALVISAASGDSASDSNNNTLAENGSSNRESRLYLNNRININRRLNLPLYSNCTTQLNSPGLCLRFSECARSSGVPSGLCSVTGVCCSISLACNTNTNAKKVIITDGNLNTADCTYTFTPYSQNVCQLRVDFTTALSNPTPPTDPTVLPVCTDYIEMGGYRFCGVNNRQHIYLPMNGGNQATQVITVRITTAGSWELVVTQVECSPKLPISTFNTLPQGQLLDLRNLLTPKNYDPDLIAPMGCLQYFTNLTGTIRSFNFFNGVGTYPPNMEYAICIKRPSSSSGLRLFATTFSLSFNDPNQMFDDGCHDNFGTVGATDDYLLIPFSEIPQAQITAIRYCGNIMQGQNLISTTRGPYVIYFKSGNNIGIGSGIQLPPASIDPQYRGFEINYNVL